MASEAGEAELPALFRITLGRGGLCVEYGSKQKEGRAQANIYQCVHVCRVRLL